MSHEELIQFLAGAVALTHLVASGCFLRFWRKTGDRLFLSFGQAFLLFAINQVVVAVLGVTDERTGLAYFLRVIGFLLIVVAIIRKNLGGTPRPS